MARRQQAMDAAAQRQNGVVTAVPTAVGANRAAVTMATPSPRRVGRSGKKSSGKKTRKGTPSKNRTKQKTSVGA